MSKYVHVLRIAAIAVAGVAPLAHAQAPWTGSGQGYPVKPMRLVVPFAPGGATDILARLVAQKIHERWGQTGVVENRPGGGGNIGADFVAKAAPDGYTLMVGGVPHAIGMSLYQKLPYDLAKDLVAIGNLATFPSIIAVHPSLPAKSVKALLTLAKARPGQLNYGALAGSPNHLAIELLNMMGGVKMALIPYKGGGQVVTDLVAGQVQLASVGFPAGLPMVQAGRLRAIAVTGEQRAPTLREVPTVVESGIHGYVVTSWYGMFGPAALPRDIVSKWSGELTNLLAAADVKERLATLGADPAPMAAEPFGRFVREEIARWAKVVKVSGATAN